MGFFTKKSSPKQSVALLVIGAAVIWWMASSDSKPDPHPSNIDINTSWEELNSEYGSNEIAFNDRYKNATFHLSGKVISVSDAGGPEVSLITDEGTSFDAGFFDNQRDQLKSLAPDDEIAFHCLRFNSGVDVDRCKMDSVKKASD